MRGYKITTLAILAALIIASMPATIRAPALPPPEYLYVDGFDATWVEWTPVGASPYLDAPGDGSYISGGVPDASYMGWFTFEDINPALLIDFNIDKVWLEGYTDGPYTGDVDFDIYNAAFDWLGSMWANDSPQWVRMRWIAPDQPTSDNDPSLLSESGLNAFKVMVYYYDPTSVGVPGDIVDSLRLMVTFKEKPPEKVTQLYMSPRNSTAPVGGTVSIDIMVANVTDLAGYEFKFGFDPLILQGTEIIVGDFFPTSYVWKNTIDNTNGIAWLGVTRPLGTPGGISGSGKLATVNFEVVAPGVTLLDLYDTKLGDRLAVPIVHEVITPGDVSTYIAAQADLRYRRSTNRPEHYNFKIAVHGDIQTLYGEIENVGTIPVQAAIQFEVYDETGGAVVYIKENSATVTLQPGESRVVSLDMTVTPDMANYRFYVTNTCKFDSDGDGTLESTGPSRATYTFKIKPE